MPKYLVIVESPAKVKTIKKFLGKDYEVMASNGHVRDLPKSTMGIDVEHGCEPRYITIRGKGDILSNLRKAEKKADKVYLATDPDREGEAISWHLAAALKLDPSEKNRITFNEITKTAVKESLKHPRVIDQDLVDAQQARRLLDRMVGYQISPLLWKKVKRGLSAGRVQSAALRIVADREKEINEFLPEEYWTLDAYLKLSEDTRPLCVHFIGKEKKQTIHSEAEVQKILEELKGKEFLVSEVRTGERTRKAPAPYTTSTMQQDAANHLNFSTQKTMSVAQQLYEGVELQKSGTVGLITYLRTDSVRVSEEAEESARSYIIEAFGDTYYEKKAEKKADAHKIQDAHEAIRPSDIRRTPETVKESLSRDQFRLYQLIWMRFVASQMAAARYETTNVKIQAGEYLFQIAASRKAFEGFQKIYSLNEEKEEALTIHTRLEKGMKLSLDSIEKKQHFTQPPAHYTEASLVHALEELGIGRPSTYAPTISTIVGRRYVTKENKNIYMTEIGDIVNDMMEKAFPEIVDVTFTANMESLLDSIEEGTINWRTVLENFYPDLEKAVQEAEDKLEKVTIADEVTDVICEECGRNMVIKYGPHGKFLACPGFPECRNTLPYLEKAGISCPKCGKEVVYRKTKKGRRYYGCEQNPECDFMSWQKPAGRNCPKCGIYMVEKGKKAQCTGCGFTCDL